MYSLKNLCFLCLSRSSTIKSVTFLDEDGIIVQEKLESVLLELIQFKPEIPKKICVECLKGLNYVYKFKQKCLENLRELGTYLDKVAVYATKCKSDPDCDEISQNEDTHRPEEIIIKVEPVHDNVEEETRTEFVNINDKIDIKDELPSKSDSFTKIDIKDILQTKPEKVLHKCFECQKIFKKKSNLTAHERVHTGIKPFECDECEKAFNQKTHLVLHKRIHSGIKPYECSVCEKKFTKHGHLISHQRKHSGERPFCCALCDKTFVHQASLLYHKRTHSNEKPFKCEVCPYKCTTRSNLKLHIKRMHTKVKFL